MTPVLHYPLLEPHNARGIPPSEASCRTSRGQRTFEHTTARHRAHCRLARQDSPNKLPPAAHPRKSSPNKHKNTKCGVLWRTGRAFSRTGRSDVAALKPTTPLQPLTWASMKPASPLRAPKQQPLKPLAPLQPKNTPQTPISHPQRCHWFQPRNALRRIGKRTRSHTSTPGAAGAEGAEGTCRGAGGRWRGLAGLRDDAPSKARSADGSRAGRRPPAHTAAGPSGARNTRGATSTNGRNYSPARRSTSCMMRPHTALTHATAATPRTRERQGRICRKSSKP